MKRLTALLLALTLLFSAAALAAEDSYTTYEAFIGRYAANLDFINQNENRHLISLIFAGGDTKDNLRSFQLSGDVLSAELLTRGSGRLIAGLTVRLSAPADPDPASSAYRDFVTSGYQCYALLMAMVDSEDLLARYSLISELNNGVLDKDEYRTVVGPYSLTARRGEGAMLFTFSSAYWDDPRDSMIDETAGDEEGEEAAPDGESEDGGLPAGEDEDSLAG